MAFSGEIYGNVSGIQGLASEQQDYANRFHGIMNSLDSQAKQLLGQWQGAGNPGYQQRASEYQQLFQSTLQAFAKLIDATDGAANNYSKLCQTLEGMFA